MYDDEYIRPLRCSQIESVGFNKTRSFSFSVGLSFCSRVLENCEDEARFEEVSAFILRLNVCLSVSQSRTKTTLKLVIPSSGGGKGIMIEGSLQFRQRGTNRTARPCSSTSHLTLLFPSDNITEKQGGKKSAVRWNRKPLVAPSKLPKVPCQLRADPLGSVCNPTPGVLFTVIHVSILNASLSVFTHFTCTINGLNPVQLMLMVKMV